MGVLPMFIGGGSRRSGVRGGRDQFSWQDVANDKYKEFYLGHSVKIQPRWWMEDKGSSSEAPQEITEEELKRIKAAERKAMLAALGAIEEEEEETSTLDKYEMKELFARGQMERDNLETERVAGLGSEPAFTHPVPADQTAPPKQSQEMDELELQLSSKAQTKRERKEKPASNKKKK